MKEPSSSSPGPSAPREGVRETIDSVVIAFILAFVFRAFIIEAFVIPTGSMAATLNGAHGTMICPNCGWEYAYGLTDRAAASMSGNQVTDRHEAVCQNCAAANRLTEVNDLRRNQESGDRILVFKWPFDIGGDLLGPRRWDVIVFKDPADGVTNFIKRLTGLPNEVLQIIDGDVYTVPLEEVSSDGLATLERYRHLHYLLRTGSDPATARAENLALHEPNIKLLAELDGKLRIRNKTALAQEALWTVVYNHDYPPHEKTVNTPRWEPRGPGAWTVGERNLQFRGSQAGEETLAFIANIDSHSAYNVIMSPRSIRLRRPVSDLRVRCVVDYHAGDGAVRLALTKRDDVFMAELAADGSVRLLRGLANQPGEPVVVATIQRPALRPHDLLELSLENVDHRVAICVDGDEVLATSPEQYAPNVQALRLGPVPEPRPPTISARALDVDLAHVVVEKDVYYLSDLPEEAMPLSCNGWGTRGQPIMLRAGEHFVLGDNSAQSKDSRLWNEVGPHLLPRGEEYQLGTVPEDQLIGRAFFVYWPCGLRTRIIPPLQNLGWIPNFGRMRWIR